MELGAAQSPTDRVNIAFQALQSTTKPFRSLFREFRSVWDAEIIRIADPKTRADRAWGLVGEFNQKTLPHYLRTSEEALEKVTERGLTNQEDIAEMRRELDNAQQFYIGCVGQIVDTDIRKALEQAIILCKEVWRECRRLIERNASQQPTKPKGGKKHDQWARAEDRNLTLQLKEAGGVTEDRETDWFGRRKHPKDRKGRRK